MNAPGSSAGGTAGTEFTPEAPPDGSAGAGHDPNAAPDAGSAGQGSGCTQFGQPEAVGAFEDAELNGPSGIAASRAAPGVLYTQLDQGGPATVFATTVAGAPLAEYRLDALDQVDWEDLAVGPGPGDGQFIYVADIGDNAAGGMGSGDTRTEIQVYRFAEPSIESAQAFSEQTVQWERLRFTYPDGAQNSESLFVDPQNGDLVILTKSAEEAIVYRAPADSAVDTPTVLEEIARASVGASTAAAADISPTGDRILVRTYEALLLWPRPAGVTLAAAFAEAPIALPAADEPRSEGVAFSANGDAWYSAGEEDNTIHSATAACP